MRASGPCKLPSAVKRNQCRFGTSVMPTQQPTDEPLREQPDSPDPPKPPLPQAGRTSGKGRR